MTDTEVWKDVVDYEGMYEVSSFGRIKSLKRRVQCGRPSRYTREVPERIMKAADNGYGYLILLLNKEGKTRSMRVHRLVAQAFLSDYSEELQVNHIDETKINNRLENLEMCTCQYNIEYSKAKHYKVIPPNGKPVDVFNLAKFCRDNDLDKSHMCQVALGTANQHKGWTRYIDLTEAQ